MDRTLDYAVPDALADRVTPGCLVRVPLHGRRVRGWVVESDVEPIDGLGLAEVAKLTGLAVDSDVVDLARWMAWRWVGRLPSVLRLATPPRVVSAPSRRPATAAQPSRVAQGNDSAFGETSALLDRGPGTRVYQVSPCTDHAAVALAAAARGQALIITPDVEESSRVAAVLARAGSTVVRWPGGTAGALGGHSVVGGHTAVLAPMPRLTAIVVLDEHDERHQNQSSPTWHAREVAIERARRVGIPCLLVSPMPSLEARMATVEPVASVDTASRRSGWARIDVVDRRRDDPRTGLFSPRFADRARRELDAGRAVVCVLNRTGRSRLLACRSCDSIAECEVCGAAVRSSDDEVLECIRCSTTRPKVCLRCGSLAMKVLRTGVARVREDLGSLLGCEVGLVTASERDLEGARLIVGTEAVLHDTQDSLGSEVGLVALLDLDQELLAARYRASEQALGLLVLASRLVAGRRGSILVQTRNPSHEVIAAALATDPAVVCTADWPRREMLGLPPAASLAAVGGEAAREWIQRFGHPQGVEVQGPNDGWWLLRADDPVTLADAAGAVKRPPGRLRLRVDPMQLPVT
jgi:primosomal protein N' (replication factor Y)